MLDKSLISFLKNHGVFYDFLKLLVDRKIKLRKEVWKTIDLEGVDLKFNYMVSNYGRVKNSDFGNYVKGSKNKDGYVRMDLKTTDGRVNIFAHRLVAIMFICDSNLEVNHKFMIKALNYVDCIEWSTRSENMIHLEDNGLSNKRKIVLKLDSELNVICEYKSLVDASKENNLKKANLSALCRNMSGISINNNYSLNGNIYVFKDFYDKKSIKKIISRKKWRVSK